MLSCTEFVLLYSELFKFIDDKEGKDGVNKYWEYISDTYVADLLGKAVEKEGLKGCWTYWNKSLNEEACDFKMTLDEDSNDFSIYMSGCPSKKLINEHGYMKPYKNYCGHCEVLYDRVLRRYGIELYDHDYSNVATCKCVEHYRKMLVKNDKKLITYMPDALKQINNKKVENFVLSLNESTPCKRYDFDDKYFVNVVEYETTNDITDEFEFHKEHIDIHYLIYGEEKILFSNDIKYDRLDYDNENDGGIVKTNSDGAIQYKKGQAVIVFADTLHMAGYAVNKKEKIKKAIIKIKI